MQQQQQLAACVCHSTDLANALLSPPFLLFLLSPLTPPRPFSFLLTLLFPTAAPSACVVLCVAYSISYIRLLPAWQLCQLPPPQHLLLLRTTLCVTVWVMECVCVCCACVCELNNFQLSASLVILQNNFQTAFAAAAAKFTAQLWASCVASHAPPLKHPLSGHWQQESPGY